MASHGSGSDGEPLSAGSVLSSYSSTSSSSRDGDMASKLQKTSSLTVRVLQEITDNFSVERKIGQGAYGQVYRGEFENGEEIAVKMLYNSTPGIDDVQFQREFGNLMRLEHHNIVRLVGYCYETQHQPIQYMGKTIFTERIHRALCFEYMENGSLEKHLSDECDGLDWHTRYKIIKGSWKGLKHLHEGSDEPIYHLDLKPDNILLDKNMMPKLADFGLSKLFTDKQTMITQSPMGTIGYLPREFLHGHVVSNKFDIFSLGVVMIKIIAGHGGYSRSAEMPRQEFIDLVHENWRNRMLKTCGASQTLEAYCEQVNICTEIALSCMETDRHKRPNIADIINQLNGTEDVIVKALSSPASTQVKLQALTKMVKLEVLPKAKAVSTEGMLKEFPILVRVMAQPWSNGEKMTGAGLDLVLVVDLAHFKLHKITDIKDAIMSEAIDKLGPNDRLSIVSERTMNLRFMSEKGRDAARIMVLKLPFDRFDMADYLEKASEILKGREVGEVDKRVGSIVLLCLGNANRDILTQKFSCQFPVHTLGLTCGEHNAHNAEVLKYVADKTSGTYSCIREKDLRSCGYALNVIIGHLSKLAATSIKVTLTAHEGVAISSIESGGYSSHVNLEQRSGEIDINDIYAGETKNFIVKLKLGEGMGKLKLVTIGGQYWSSGQYWRRNGSKQLLADTDVFVLCSDIAPVGELAIHTKVAAELVRVELVKGLSAELDHPRPMAHHMEVLWEKIRCSEMGVRTPEETLKYFDEVMLTVKEENKMGGEKKLPYALSWLSSQERQRKAYSLGP